MVTPFDKSDLLKRLEGRGLTALEGLADIVVEETFAWAEDSLNHPQTSTLVKAIGVPAVGILRPLAEGLVEKIDGKEG